jgi:hypothetical protein
MNRIVTPARVGVVLAGAALVAVAVWAVAGKLPVSKRHVVAAVPVAAHSCAQSTGMTECASAAKTMDEACGACPACPACPAAPSRSTAAPATAERVEEAPMKGPGMVAAIDPETGELGAPTPEQAAALRPLGTASASESEGILEQHHADGSVSVTDLSGRFQEYMLVKVGPDGKLQKVCVDASQKGTVLKKPPAPAPKPLEEK